ncbi:rhomboid family intramembrane serine protease [Rubricoccus marinus]|uniref:Rhomboid family intramembrane serine protease n=1 Tax=Rubricoccus marinus TaxID=716817 RepID=A0A259TWG6_9BACT|nr:rhomboid family intramembrane serine protease [Rubricoccus marinus]OZC02105.1 rhomboid family intramembrane serine protease [Rubricoccus marinus]
MLAELIQTPVSLFFLTLNLLVGAYSLFVDPSLIGKWAFRPYVVRQRHELGRWVTAGFVHVGLAHLAFNMITLYYFGPQIEGVLGPWRFLAIYLGSELAANALTYWRHKDDPNYSAVGASGAISGVLFSFVLFAPFAMLGVMFIIPMPAIVFAVLYVALSIYSSKQGGGRIAHEAHLGGALGGVVLTILLYPPVIGIFLSELGLG